MFPSPTAPAATSSGLADGALAWRRSFAEGLRPDPVVTVAEWSDRHRIVPEEASPYPGQWDTARAPYLREPMECLSPADACERVSVKKGAQLGFSDIGINWIGTIVDVYQGPAMLVQPTVDLAKAFVREKLDPSIRATRKIANKVRADRSRQGDGSTTLFKRFPGGFLICTGANSSAGLQMRSVRYLFKDELTEWPLDADGRGDPENQAESRTDAYRQMRKIYEPSTPGVEGSCRISKRYEESDKRRFYLPCPECGHAQVLLWERLRYAEEEPHEARYACEACEALIAHHHKREMLARGRWIAEAPGPGRHPGFWISQLYSPFKSWDDLVRDWKKAEGDPRREKVFTQQVLGEAWREAGEAPPAERLHERRDDYPIRTLPPGVLVVTLGVDVGKDHLIWEVVGWGVGKRSWSIDCGKISVGDTANLNNWKALDEIYAKQYPDADGVLRGIDMTAVDSGYNSHTVYQYCRTRTNVMAVDGRDGWTHPPLGLPKAIDVAYAGRKIKKGVKLWPVGTWTLKSELYAALRKEIDPEAPETAPVGYCHFSRDHDMEFFEELTNEILTTTTRGDREIRKWVRVGPNHYHDCRIYAMAAAERLGLSRFTIADWQALAAQREVPEEAVQRDLEALWAQVRQPAAEGAPEDGSDKPAAEAKSRRRRVVKRSKWLEGGR